MRILFICAANTFRSQLAEQVFRTEFGAGFEVRSAGLLKAHAGKRVRDVLVPETVDILRRHDVEMPEGVCRRVGRRDMVWADLVLVMELWMKGMLSEEYPKFAGKVHLLREFAGYPGNPEIHDAGVVTEARVMMTYRQVEAAIKRIKRLNLLTNGHN